MANLYPENLYFEDAEIGTSLTGRPLSRHQERNHSIRKTI